MRGRYAKRSISFVEDSLRPHTPLVQFVISRTVTMPRAFAFKIIDLCLPGQNQATDVHGSIDFEHRGKGVVHRQPADLPRGEVG